MDRSDVEALLVDQLAGSRDVSRDDVLRDLARDGTVDSLEGLELAVAAEEAFGIAISDDEISSEVCRSFSALVRLVQSKLTQPDKAEEAAR